MLRRAVVLGEPDADGLLELELLEGPLAGRRLAAVCYPELGKVPREGEEILANTLGPEMGLGTGGLAVAVPTGGLGKVPENRDHFVKLPYTPLQHPASPPGESAGSLRGVPVAVLPLHSHLAPACCAAGALRPGCRVAFVWQEGGALPVGLSVLVRKLREQGLLSVVVSAGNCFGGDVEAPNVYAALLAAAAAADLVLAGIGPGVVGTGSPYGHGGMAAAAALNAACALGGEPVFAPRFSLADPRPRHRGLSHHTRSVLEAALAPCRVALPEGVPQEELRGLPGRHRYVPVPFGAAGLEGRFGLTFESMGRGYEKDPVFFDAAAAAVALALGEVDV
ncbi:hypothetical protein Rxycam_00483 [Rubrobacter xylanophilus DSM 9941]|uniref:DUF3866 family protein n=1 Tax=Rubrobacter xylanophilus TaxID=49319 RepID=UPI001C642EFA|nr:DUF3866 family protein [Rubrobacter xylanophilus]QYJ14681.1 hypothetical protein Rxycam_00483 [Rubrobacter xylanophilus DSM 9941]